MLSHGPLRQHFGTFGACGLLVSLGTSFGVCGSLTHASSRVGGTTASYLVTIRPLQSVHLLGRQRVMNAAWRHAHVWHILLPFPGLNRVDGRTTRPSAEAPLLAYSLTALW